MTAYSMATRERIDKDYIAAVKEKDAATVSILRMLRAALKNAEIDKMSELEEADVIDVIGKEVKKLKDSLESFEQGGRDDLAAQTRNELETLAKYTPEEMGDDELRQVIARKHEELGELTQADFGRLMKEVMAEVKGRVQGNKVSALVKEELAK